MAILSTLMAFASISTDLYLPALPAMGASLGADAGTMELTISGYLVGFSLGQLFWGPISDRFGRRGPVAVGILLFIAGSAGCALSASAETLILWRLVQAAGACASVVLARAMVRDLYDRERAAQMLSTLIVIMAIAPLLGPIVGAQIVAVASWRAIFWVLVVVGLATLGALCALPETLPPAQRSASALSGAAATYRRMLGNRRYVGHALIGGFFYAGVWAYIAATPAVYITYYRVPTALYGLLFGANILAIMGMNLVNSRLIPRFGSDRLLKAGAVLAAVSGLVTAVLAGTGWGGLTGLFLALFVYAAASGMIIANSIAGAMALFPERAGAASALIGALQYGLGIAGSAVVGIFADGTPWPLGWLVASAGCCAALCIVLLRSRAPSPVDG